MKNGFILVSLVTAITHVLRLDTLVAAKNICSQLLAKVKILNLLNIYSTIPICLKW
jgi:hypothetical protein